MTEYNGERPTDGPRLSGPDFARRLDSLQMSIREVSRLWGVDRRTVTRWTTGELDIPPWVPLVLDLIKSLIATKNALERITGSTNAHAKSAGLILVRVTGQDHPLPVSVVRE
jgi:hypothetical protein